MNWQEVAAIGGIALAVLTPLAKWLIHDWFKKATELEELKESKQNTAIKELKAEISSVKDRIRGMNTEISKFYNSIEDHDRKVFSLVNRIDDIKSDMCEVAKANAKISGRLESLIKSEVKSQITELGKVIKAYK